MIPRFRMVGIDADWREILSSERRNTFWVTDDERLLRGIYGRSADEQKSAIAVLRVDVCSDSVVGDGNRSSIFFMSACTSCMKSLKLALSESTLLCQFPAQNMKLKKAMPTATDMPSAHVSIFFPFVVAAAMLCQRVRSC